MSKTTLVAGATGNLGGKIVNALIERGATIKAIVRSETSIEKITALQHKGVEVIKLNMQDKTAVADACTEVDCVVSALSGLADVIIDTQKILVDAAIVAKVPKFIPSDFSLDFTNLEHGRNRNLDLRRTFHEYLDKLPIRVTTIFNGAFMDLLKEEMPLILYKFNRILSWGDATVKMDFTTMDDVATYTAWAAMDADTPRYLRIAGDNVNVADVRNIMTEITGKKYRIFKPGGIARLNSFIGLAKFFSKNTTDLYPAWQGMQYMRDMMEGKAVISNHDNDRYPGVPWTNIKNFLSKPKTN
jgi:nucleoside-diphosphate-sugar epimerase